MQFKITGQVYGVNLHEELISMKNSFSNVYSMAILWRDSPLFIEAMDQSTAYLMQKTLDNMEESDPYYREKDVDQAKLVLWNKI